VPGSGWGCVVCGLPADGAIAVLCDGCLDHTPRFAVHGYADGGGRILIDELREAFDHDLSRHAELEELLV